MLIIIPAYNEEATVGKIVKQCAAYGDVLVVDDGSSDLTGYEAASEGAYVITHRRNKGYGEALQTGYRFAWEKGYQFIVQMDADGQHDPAQIPALIKGLKGADVVIGSRFIDTPGYKIPFCRKIGMGLFAYIASRICGVKVTDTTSGFRAINRTALGFCTTDKYPRDYPDANAICMMHKAGLRLREIPVTMQASEKKASMHSGVKPVFYIFRMLYSLGRG
jgi:glycosyltransferase involved in cell wall biosynthesis